jgi:hypothetical protein
LGTHRHISPRAPDYRCIIALLVNTGIYKITPGVARHVAPKHGEAHGYPTSAFELLQVALKLVYGLLF